MTFCAELPAAPGLVAVMRLAFEAWSICERP